MSEFYKWCGLGTGLAPFRAFVQERQHSKEEGKPLGDTILYFGCRKRSEDYIYEDELCQFESNGAVRLYVAFSREQAEKQYVTHLLEQHLEEVWRVIGESNGHIYICG